jgi:hypothetical protein
MFLFNDAGHTMGGRIATPKNTESSVTRWRQLREACSTLKAMEAKLRQQNGVQRGLMADKVSKLRPI